ncbi:E3 SUMO-protein ligase pli1 [Hypsizygus marmoreus]|uniref:E3 SUMO-protein ligase pli1 n=1 Tax=Hypsizygus marmoreus TaxID=39966 RepID=A0A369K7H1_HYPMA|nr:E3 SUMO-protein ligase pli1 [Hypsizygus marmoreus]
MTSSDAWLDFEQVRHTIKNNTVDKLKQILSGFNEECGIHISKTGKKQEVIDRIVSALDSWRAANMEDKWMKAKGVIYQVRNTGSYTPSRMTANPAVLPPSTIHHNVYPLTNILKTGSYATVAGSSTIARYDPYAPPRKATSSSAPVASTSSATSKPTGIRFKESPFFTIDQAVSAIVECPESTSATDRRQQTVTFTLNNDQLAKLKSPGSKFQLRLFCTSSIFYSGLNSFRTSTVPCPIEFPPTCEVRVNNVQLTANLKGLKKKPGTAPPPDLGKYARLTNVQNRIEMVYVNSQQPAQSKKYYLVVMLVEATTVDRLVSNLKATKQKSSLDIRRSMVASLSEDDDIIAGPQKMSLKCPLSFMRINTPCRSSQCVHSQCFDATSWFSVMEQTTTWLCPVCERALDSKDLIIDGYFDEILKQTPESVEDVIVEADGEWHTSDNKYGSPAWKTLHPVSAVPVRKPPSTSQQSSRSPSKPTNTDSNGKAKAVNREIFVLDSDDEDESQVKRELSPSFASGSPATSVPQSQSQSDQVIDLTLDSDDEEPPPVRQNGKRKAVDADVPSTSPTEQIWKKSRLDSQSFGGGSSTNDDYRASGHTTSRATAPLQPLRYAAPYQGTSLSSDYPTYSAGDSSLPSPRLPLPSINALLPRTNGRWP